MIVLRPKAIREFQTQRRVGKGIVIANMRVESVTPLQQVRTTDMTTMQMIVLRRAVMIGMTTLERIGKILAVIVYLVNLKVMIQLVGPLAD